MKETECERVFLIKELPEDLGKYTPLVIKTGDYYKPNRIDSLKIRQKGDKYEIRKKETLDLTTRIEHRIPLLKQEFDLLYPVATQKHNKLRYLYPLGKQTCELDLYQGKLLGYVRAEVEFKNSEEMNSFLPPEWFAEEITSFNHEIHEDLGLVSFDDMKERYVKRGIRLKRLLFK